MIFLPNTGEAQTAGANRAIASRVQPRRAAGRFALARCFFLLLPARASHEMGGAHHRPLRHGWDSLVLRRDGVRVDSEKTLTDWRGPFGLNQCRTAIELNHVDTAHTR